MMNFNVYCNGSSGGSRKFWWGGFEAQNLKNSDVFTKIESDFSAEIGNSNVFFAQVFFEIQIQVVSKKKVFTKIESDFSAEIGNSNVFFAQIQVVSKKNKKKRKVFSSIRCAKTRHLRRAAWRRCGVPPNAASSNCGVP